MSGTIGMILLLCLSISTFYILPSHSVKLLVTQLAFDDGKESLEVHNNLVSDDDMNIVCFNGLEKRLHRLFVFIYLHLDCQYTESPTNKNDTLNQQAAVLKDLILRVGDSPGEVAEDSTRYFDWWRELAGRTDSVSLPPFKRRCVGIKLLPNRDKPSFCAVRLRWKIEILYVLGWIIGLLLFIYAEKLSSQTTFYYACGTSVGVLASLMLLVYIVNKYIPMKRWLVGAMAFSSMFTLFVAQHVYNNLQSLLMQYYALAIAYIGTVSMISFGLLYWYGPVTNPRTINLTKWTLQFVGLAFIVAFSQIPEFGMLVVSILLLYHLVPWQHFWFPRLQAVRYRVFGPPKRKLLTEEEFLAQSSAATQKGLEELREFCRSPKCDAWKTLCRLENPARFAHFIDGDSHIQDDELMSWDDSTVPEQSDGEDSDDMRITDDEDVEQMPPAASSSTPNRSRVACGTPTRHGSSYSSPNWRSPGWSASRSSARRAVLREQQDNEDDF